MSPIKNLSEKVRLPRLGKVRLGIKKEGEKGPYPSATDYFVCPPEIQAVAGEKPKSLKILFPTEDEGMFAQQWLKCYSNVRGLICRGNGETSIARVDIKTGEIASRDSKNTELKEILCDPDNCDKYKKKQCRHVMNLQFLLPDVPGFGVWQLDTTSYNSIMNINSGIKFVRSICGRIAMIPLSLELRPQEVIPEETGTKKTVHVLNISANYSLAEIQKFAQMPANQILILPPPATEAPDDLYPDEIISEEAPDPKTDLKKPFEEAGGKPEEKKPEPPKQPGAIQKTLTDMGAKEVKDKKPEEKKPDTKIDPKWKTLGFFSQEEQTEVRKEIYNLLSLYITPDSMKKLVGKPSADMSKEELMQLMDKARTISLIMEEIKSFGLNPNEFFLKHVNKKSIIDLNNQERKYCMEELAKMKVTPEDLPF